MERGIDKVRDAVRALVPFHPRQLTNHFFIPDDDDEAQENNIKESISCTGDVEEKRIASLLAAHEELRLADSVERLVTELTAVLSCGLRRGVTLWTVLQTLTLLPQRCQAAMTMDEAHDTAATVASTSVTASETTVNTRSTSHRFRFTAQLVHLVETTFAEQPGYVKARVLLRLALNQGCLLAALALLRRYNATELSKYYDPSHGCLLLNDVSPSTSVAPALLSECNNKGNECRGQNNNEEAEETWWPSFIAASSLVGGTTLEALEQGAVLEASYLRFRLALFVPGVDAVLEDQTEKESSTADFHALVEQYIQDSAQCDTVKDDALCTTHAAPSAWRCFYLNALHSRTRASHSTATTTALHMNNSNGQDNNCSALVASAVVDQYPRRLAVTVLPVNRTPRKSQSHRGRCHSSTNTTSVTTPSSSVVASQVGGNATPSARSSAIASGIGCGVQSEVASQSTTHGPRGRRRRKRRHGNNKAQQTTTCTLTVVGGEEEEVTTAIEQYTKILTSPMTMSTAEIEAVEEDNAASQIETNVAPGRVDENIAIEAKALPSATLINEDEDDDIAIDRMLDELEVLVSRYHDYVTSVTAKDATSVR